MPLYAGFYWTLFVGILVFLLFVLVSIVLYQLGGFAIRCCHTCTFIATHGLGEFLNDPYEFQGAADGASTPLVGP